MTSLNLESKIEQKLKNQIIFWRLLPFAPLLATLMVNLPHGNLMDIAIGGIFGIMGVSLINPSKSKIQTLEQKIRNTRANDFLAINIDNSYHLSGALLLRSFTLDSAFGDRKLEYMVRGEGAAKFIPAALGQMVIGLPGVALNARETIRIAAPKRQYECHLLKILARALPEAIPCSVGNAGPLESFGRIQTSDHDWKSVVEKLLNQSVVIVFMFGPGGGTSWELTRIIERSELLARTIFVTPPADQVLSDSELDRYYFQKDYGFLAERMLAIDVIIPDYTPDLAFSVQDNGAVSAFTGYDKFRPSAEVVNLFSRVGVKRCG